MKRISISHQPPSHGWLTLQLMVDGQIVEIDASYTPNNPVQELISALYSAAGGAAATVWFHLEPDGYYVNFEPIGDNIRFELDYAAESERSRSSNIFAIESSREDILFPFWRFLRDFQSRGYPEQDWPEVDYRDMDSIKKQIVSHPVRS